MSIQRSTDDRPLDTFESALLGQLTAVVDERATQVQHRRRALRPGQPAQTLVQRLRLDRHRLHPAQPRFSTSRFCAWAMLQAPGTCKPSRPVLLRSGSMGRRCVSRCRKSAP